MFRTMLSKLNEMMQDDGLTSFGKVGSLPFLISAWAIGTVQGIRFAMGDKDVSDLIWTMAGVAMVLYGTYKTGKVLISRGSRGKTEVGEGTSEQ
jgi:hypothetical protein